MITKIFTLLAVRTVLGRVAALVLSLSLVAGAAACGSSKADGGPPHVVVTTNVLGDVVRELVGPTVRVDVIMPPGSSPHDFAPSPRDAAAIRDAGVLVVNGMGFEGGLHDVIEAAREDGVTVLVATDALDRDDAGHSVIEADPHGAAHFFTDPVLMASVVEHLASGLAEHVSGLSGPDFDRRVAAYEARLTDLDAEVRRTLSTVPQDRRVLVTNHEVFGRFADRYDFEVLGVVVPGGATLAEPNAAALARLSQQIKASGVPAIFADASSPARLVKALAAEGTPVDVVELFSESLGGPGTDGSTYLDMVRTNAERIAAALTPSG